MTPNVKDLVFIKTLKRETDRYVVALYRHLGAEVCCGCGKHESSADVSFSFYVDSVDENQQKLREKRCLFFKLEDFADRNIGKHLADKFFRALLADLPMSSDGQPYPDTDFVANTNCFIKNVVTLLRSGYNEFSSVLINSQVIRGNEIDETPGVIGVNPEVYQVSAKDIQQLIEFAFPNGLGLSTIVELSRVSQERAVILLEQLEAAGTVKKVGEAWIRVHTDNINVDVATHLNSFAPFSDKPTIAIITRIFVEKLAVDSLLENPHTVHNYKPGDGSTVFTVGYMGLRCVLTTKLSFVRDVPEISPGDIVKHLLDNFPNIHHVFIVGVGGSVPHVTDASLHARLGDVIVSASHKHPYVSADDIVRSKKTKKLVCFKTKNFDSPDKTIEEIVSSGGSALLSQWNHATAQIVKKLERSEGAIDWKAPPESTDVLKIRLPKGKTVTVVHPQRESTGPQIHLGTIGSTSMVTLNRTGITTEQENEVNKAFVNTYGIRCLDHGFNFTLGAVVSSWIGSWTVIRGISDYHDGKSRFGNIWQAHATVRAAAVTQCIIEQLPLPNPIRL